MAPLTQSPNLITMTTQTQPETTNTAIALNRDQIGDISLKLFSLTSVLNCAIESMGDTGDRHTLDARESVRFCSEKLAEMAEALELITR